MRNLSLNSLVGFALQHDWDSDDRWKAIAELQARGSPETLAVARRLAKSRNYRKRALGLDIASQLRRRDTSAPLGSVEYALEATQEMLLAGLRDASVDVLGAAISGLGHRPHPWALPTLVQLAGHSNENIRFSVAVALGHYHEPEAIDALILLAKDQANDVRDWATFGLGSMQDADSPKVRESLWSNIHDPDDGVRGEALVGLAARKDERVIPILLERLTIDCQVFELDAAELMASPQLLDSLCRIKDTAINDGCDLDGYWYKCLLRAIDACSPK